MPLPRDLGSGSDVLTQAIVTCSLLTSPDGNAEFMMAGPDKRIPGQRNADYDGPHSDPNADFIGTSSLYGGGDPTWAMRLVRAISGWWRRRRTN